MAEELKPCHRCESEPRYRDTVIDGIKTGARYWYECPKCFVSSAMMGSEPEARASWNTRPIEDALRQEIVTIQEQHHQWALQTDEAFDTMEKHHKWELKFQGKIISRQRGDIITKQSARILQLEQELAAATARVTGLEQDYRGLLHKADSWERGMQYNAELCAEKDARIAELEKTNQEQTDLVNSAISTLESQSSVLSELQNNHRAILNKAVSWETEVARIAQMEDVHLVEEGDLPTDNKSILWTDGAYTYIGGVDTFITGNLWWANDNTATDAVAWLPLPDLLALAQQKRARRAAEAGAGGSHE